jgi:hypothetical protein
MKCIVLALAACGSTPAPAPHSPPQPTPPPTTNSVQDTRTALEQRRDAACEIVGKRTAQCASDDSKALFAAGKIKEAEYKSATDPRVVTKDAEVYTDKCKAKRDYSSRQIRVLEKCPEYEQACDAFLQCLQNLQPPQK